MNRPFAGQGHVTMSIIKIGGGTKWLLDLKRKEHNEISWTLIIWTFLLSGLASLVPFFCYEY